MTQYFQVSADWMEKAGRGEEAQSFEVIRIEHDTSPEYDKMILNAGGVEWPVFRMRGRMIKPYTIIIVGGHIEPALVANVLPIGAVEVHGCEFDTKEEARKVADELNGALHLVAVAELKTAPIETVRKGTIVRRLWADGRAMSKDYIVDAYDKDSGKYALLDGKGGVYWLKAGLRVALV